MNCKYADRKINNIFILILNKETELLYNSIKSIKIIKFFIINGSNNEKEIHQL